MNLPTQARLLPIHLESFSEPLHSVLRFDLELSGRCELVSAPRKSWADRGVTYTIGCREVDGKLTATLTRISTGRERTLSVPLTGNAGRDRRAVHQLADAIHEVMFGKPGIASMQLLYTVEYPSRGARRSEVWIADYDGHNARRLSGGESLSITPVFLPPAPGHRAGSYVYVNYVTGQPKIYAAQMGETQGKRLISLRGNQLTPAISPQRDQIAFISDAGGNPDLFLQHFSPESGAVGKPQQIFSARNSAQASPTFSPDGRRLAFVSGKDGSPRVYLFDLPEPGVRVVGAPPRMITRVNRENTCPCWSPDGKRIAYSARSGGARQIWIYDFETGQEHQLTEGLGHKENPCWAPDSEHLIYNSANRDSSELYLVGLHNRKPVRLTSGPGEKRFPSLAS